MQRIVARMSAAICGNDDEAQTLLPDFTLLIRATLKKVREAERRQMPIQSAVLLARPRIQQDAHIYRRSTAVLTDGLSPAARDFRPGFLGRDKSADLERSPFRGQNRTQLVRALPALIYPSPVDAPHRPVVMPVCMMPEAARERRVSFRPRAPHSLRPIESTLAMASLTEGDWGDVTETVINVNRNVTRFVMPGLVPGI